MRLPGSLKTNQRRTKVLRWGALTRWQFRRVSGLPPHVVKVYVEGLHRGQHVDFHGGRGSGGRGSRGLLGSRDEGRGVVVPMAASWRRTGLVVRTRRRRG